MIPTPTGTARICATCSSPHAVFIRPATDAPQCGVCAEIEHRQEAQRRLSSLTLPRHELRKRWRQLQTESNFHRLPLGYGGWRIIHERPVANAADRLRDTAELLEKFGWDPTVRSAEGTVDAYTMRVHFRPMACDIAMAAVGLTRSYEGGSYEVILEALAVHAGVWPTTPDNNINVWEQDYLDIALLAHELRLVAVQLETRPSAVRSSG